MAKIAVLMPYAEPSGATVSRLAPRISSLRGQTVGIVNNSWQCMHVITAEYRRLLMEECGVAEVLEKQISSAQTLPAGDLEDLAGNCGAAIVGIGN